MADPLATPPSGQSIHLGLKSWLLIMMAALPVLVLLVGPIVVRSIGRVIGWSVRRNALERDDQLPQVMNKDDQKIPSTQRDTSGN